MTLILESNQAAKVAKRLSQIDHSQSKALSHAVDASVLAQDLEYFGNVTDIATFRSNARVSEILNRIHGKTLDCIESFEHFAQECGRPAAKEHGDGEILTVGDGDWKRVSAVSNMISDALNTLVLELKSALPQYNSTMDATMASNREQRTSDPVDVILSDITLIATYFSARRGPASDSLASELYDEIQKRKQLSTTHR